MKSSTFIEFSCWITGTNQGNLGDHQLILDELTTGFWPATKVRNQRWNKALDEIEPSLPLAKPNDDCWSRFQRISDEILLSETLSRVWFAAIISKTADADIIDIAQCIIPDHVKTRKRALLMWDRTPDWVLEFAQRARTVQTLRDQINDLLLSQVSEEVVGRNLSISFDTFDRFFSCRYDYAPDVLRKAHQVLSTSLVEKIDNLKPFDCDNLDLNMKTLVSIQNSFGDDPSEDLELASAGQELAE